MRSLGNRQAEVLQRIHRGGLCGRRRCLQPCRSHRWPWRRFRSSCSGDCGEARHVGEVTHVVVRGLEFLHDVLTTEEGRTTSEGVSASSVVAAAHEALGNQIRNLGVEPIQELHGFGRVLGTLEHGHAGTTIRRRSWQPLPNQSPSWVTFHSPAASATGGDR